MTLSTVLASPPPPCKRREYWCRDVPEALDALPEQEAPQAAAALSAAILSTTEDYCDSGSQQALCSAVDSFARREAGAAFVEALLDGARQRPPTLTALGAVHMLGVLATALAARPHHLDALKEKPFVERLTMLVRATVQRPCHPLPGPNTLRVWPARGLSPSRSCRAGRAAARRGHGQPASGASAARP